MSSHSMDEMFEFHSFCALSWFFRGFTKFTRAEYLKYKSEGRIAPDGVNAKVKELFQLFIYVLLFKHHMLHMKNWSRIIVYVLIQFQCTYYDLLLYGLFYKWAIYLILVIFWPLCSCSVFTVPCLSVPRGRRSLQRTFKRLRRLYFFCQWGTPDILLSLIFCSRTLLMAIACSMIYLCSPV